ncbi:MAG: Uma2 family endonuclease [Candidatus Competibacteraceae bacterium]|nr:Uma2 family endonuclease [Candidatus Competibacteraceae bacterium]MCB1807125.1 Uma2 family endonuclease [Candidatus Competibacteraceae bacterium]MCB1812620.1 Uma2 family endonuclease [Candidatus Competibacteraceae bacterium]
MSTVQKTDWLSPEDYLAGELQSDTKHEYVAGYVYAMTGASETHNLITGNLHAALHGHLRGKPCRVFINDMKVRVADAFYYPDLMVCCNPADNAPYFKTQPCLIIEVLSRSTQRADALEKRIAYQTLDSLQEYVLVAQHKPDIRTYRRIAGGWEEELSGADDTLRLLSVDLRLPVAEVYENITLSDETT